VGRTGIYACGESVSRRNSLESVALFSLKQEAPASIGGSTFTVIWSKSRNCYVVASELAKGHTKASCTGDKTRRLALAAITTLLLLPVGGYSYAADSVTIGTAEVNDTSGNEQTVLTVTQGDASTIGTTLSQVSTNTNDIEEEARKRKYSVTSWENADKQLQTNIDNEAAAREAGDTALDTRITNMKEYLEKQTSDNYVSKTDAAVQDGAIVRAANTIGENVALLDKGLADETAARIGADAAQDKVIQQVNQNMVDGFNTINKNMADGFNALNQADAKEAQERAAADAAESGARVAADTKLVEAVNSGVSLSNDNVLQKNTTTIDARGNVTTSKTDANEMILNKGNDNQITLNEKGIKVGTNSTVVDKDGVYTGGDTYTSFYKLQTPYCKL
jgi:hypothetical protein